MSETSDYESYEYETETETGDASEEESTSEEENSSSSGESEGEESGSSDYEYESGYDESSSADAKADVSNAVKGAVKKVTGGEESSSDEASTSTGSYEYYESSSSSEQAKAVVKSAATKVTPKATRAVEPAAAAPVAAAAPAQRQIIQHTDGAEDLHRLSPKRLMAELVGTFALCWVIYMARGTLGDPTDANGSGAPAGGLVGVALAHAFVLTAMAASFGSTSGGHFNPAVTWAFMITGEINFVVGIVYTFIQLAAGVAAGALAFALMPATQLENPLTRGIHYAAPIACAFDTNLPESEWINGINPVCDIKAFGAEITGTFFLLITIFMAGVAGHGSYSAYIAIGLALGMGVLATGPISNACLNPARALGAAAFSHNFLWRSFWVWVIGPLVASILAGLLFAVVFQSRGDKSWGVGGLQFWKVDEEKK